MQCNASTLFSGTASDILYLSQREMNIPKRSDGNGGSLDTSWLQHLTTMHYEENNNKRKSLNS